MTARPRIVDATRRIEESSGLDRPAALVQRAADALIADPARRDALHGTWLGHALHPLMTDLPVGLWTSAVMLDVLGGRQSRPAATRLVGLGLVAAAPTAVTGLAEWGVAPRRDQRTGVVHAAANTVALGLFTASYRARRDGRHLRGVVLGLAGGAATGVGGYLGGHMTSARKVSTRHPAFDDEDAGAAPLT